MQKEVVYLRDKLTEAAGDVKHYREEMHQVRNECGVVVQNAQLELDNCHNRIKELEVDNARLKTQTDLSPIMTSLSEFIQQQTEINTKILQTLEGMNVLIKENGK